MASLFEIFQTAHCKRPAQQGEEKPKGEERANRNRRKLTRLLNACISNNLTFSNRYKNASSKFHLQNATHLDRVPALPANPSNAPCPLSVSLDRIGDRWSLLIVRDMMVRGFRTFREFQNSGEGIATNILADRLRKLEKAGIIEPEKHSSDGRKVNYLLTEKGIDLAPVVMEMLIWAARHEKTYLPCAAVETVATHRKQLLDEVRRRWKEHDSTPLQVNGEWRLP
jgi:DNA-binding HxlR family transcriptional regulator